MAKSSFYKNKSSEIRLFTNKPDYSLNLSTLMIILFLLCIGIYAIDKIRFNNILLNSKGIIYRRILNNLTLKEIDFMKEIMKQEYVTTKTVLKIVENTNLSYPHNIKIKDQFIKELNLKLKTIFNTDYRPLEVRNSSIDARIKEYYFNKNFKKIINRLSVKV